MAWRDPRSLQWVAGRATMVQLVAATEHNIRNLLLRVPAELLIARATAELLLRKDDNDDDNDSDEDDSDDNGDTGEVDAMDHVMLQVKVRRPPVQSALLTETNGYSNLLGIFHRDTAHSFSFNAKLLVNQSSPFNVAGRCMSTREYVCGR